MRDEEIARVCHEAIRAYAMAFGGNEPTWKHSSRERRDDILEGVKFHRQNPDAEPRQEHELWVERRKAEGWRWGPDHSEAEKTHPCLKPFEHLVASLQAKDYIFKAIVNALADDGEGEG